MWLGSPLLLACSWSASDQQPCSICLSPALPTWVASCVRLQARSGGEAISVCCVFCAFHRRRHRYSRLHRPAALTKGQMSDSLGAAPLAQFAPASLTSTPPGAGAGAKAEMMEVRKKKKRNRDRTGGGTRKRVARRAGATGASSGDGAKTQTRPATANDKQRPREWTGHQPHG